MSSWQYIFKSLLYHRRINLAVALGVAAATAVLTGALIVGDSMRGSLRDLTLDRLGKVDEFLVTDVFFREQLSEELAAKPAFRKNYDRAVDAIFLSSATAETAYELSANDKQKPIKKATGVSIIGCEADFWELGDESLSETPEIAVGQIMINRQLADQLAIDEMPSGDEPPILITLRIAEQQAVSADSPIGKKQGNSKSLLRLKLIRILPNRSVARFGLQPSQMIPANAFVSLDDLQETLEQSDRVNAMLVAGKSIDNPPDEEASNQLRASLDPQLDDIGVLLRNVKQKYQSDGEEKTAFAYESISSARMMIPPATDEILQSVLANTKPKPVLTYLANRMEIAPATPPKVTLFGGQSAAIGEDENPSIPFSMVSGIEFGDDFKLQGTDGSQIDSLADDEIVLNSWAADILNAKPGDTIAVTFFEPETKQGETVDRIVNFRVKAIAQLTEPEKPFYRSRAAVFSNPPTLANDPDLTPYVPGVTDQESIDNWDLPFETASAINSEDNAYWDNYRTTPKAFVTLNKARELWGSRFGETTSYRLASGAVDATEIAKRVDNAALESGETLGLSFMPLKRNGLKASSGSTPFDALFLSLSFFIIASAIMLVALLFRLGIEQRANEIGVLTATGIDRGKATRLMIGEGMIVSLLGSLLGLLIGIGYAWLMLTGLTTIWVEAIVTPFLKLHILWKSLLIGLVSGIVICGITVAVTMLRTKLHSIRSLLAGQLEQTTGRTRGRSFWLRLLAVFCGIAAIGLSIAAIYLPGGEAQAGAFVGSGFLLLTALLIVIWNVLRASGNNSQNDGQLGMFAVAIRNAGRKPGRSALTIGLVAIATFLIVAISSFHLTPTEQGTGGFEWIAQSDQPIHFDLNDTEKLTASFGDDAKTWPLGDTVAMRLKPGADASCNNPYQISQPRVLGVTSEDIRQLAVDGWPEFAWAGSMAFTEEETTNPWLLLEKEFGRPRDGTKEDDPSEYERIPVVIDKNTAMYSLKIFSIGQDFELEYDENRTIKFRVVGFLANSILQGSLLISEDHFERVFSEISGYRYFLVRQKQQVEDTEKTLLAKAETETEATKQIESGLAEYGFNLQSASKLLESLLAVQNTYLKAFQSLGSLGLLLGTFGLATVQLRNVFERRKELALLSAVGFPKSRLAGLVLIEHVLLLLGGMFIGILAAFFAVIPHVWFGNAVVPWTQLLILLGTITLVGLATGLFAVRSSLKTPVLQALRGE